MKSQTRRHLESLSGRAGGPVKAPGRWLRRLLWSLGGVVALVALVALAGCCAFSAPGYRGRPQHNFDGQRFLNPVPRPHGGLRALLRWMRTRQRGPWPDASAAPCGRRPPRRVGAGALRVTYINHATVLLQLDGLNIITDPIYSDRPSPLSFAGPKRVRPPGIRFEDLPPIDVVLISHNHYDHLDLPTLRRLAVAFAPRFIVGLGNAALLARAGIARVAEIDWWQGYALVPGVALYSVPAQHFSGRGLCDRDRTLWTGYVIKSAGGSVYFAGDTGFGPHFAAIGKRFGPLRLAMLPIGAYKPRWFMQHVHISPHEALAAHEALRAGTSVAMHFGTFALGDDGAAEGPAELAQILAARSIRPRFWTLGFGEGRDVPRLVSAISNVTK